jgi:drug/metabolite transporter (DMT)-like permease
VNALLYGLVAAVGWGIADYLAAVTARRIGTFRTTFGMQASSLVIFAAIIAGTGQLPVLSADALVAALAMGALGALMLAALYRALALGPIAIVSPVAAANAAVTVLLAVVLLREVLSPLQLGAIAATIAGIALASTDLRVARETLGRPSEGVRLALVVMVGFGVLGFLLATSSRAFGPLGMVLLLRAGTTLFLILFGLTRGVASMMVPRGAFAIVVLIGVLDTSANVAFGLGALAGYASIVATGASAYPLIPFALGVTLLRERIAPNQILGVALLVGGLATLGASG